MLPLRYHHHHKQPHNVILFLLLSSRKRCGLGCSDGMLVLVPFCW